MKRTVNTFFAVLFVSVMGFVQAQDLAMAEKIAIIDFETEVVDYGTIEQGSDGMRIFVFTNTGDAPLIITDVKTSCGCTVPNYSKEPILPGQVGQLEIKYNTKKLGAFTKTVTVLSNAKEAKKVLKIKGTVVAAN
ncbi:DUF1573 domain-containing protein [Winogradskyella sp. 3972H.M.0a.05]|uniref:DUF1573 domain-containing protein n=1 Tax=Winogradskyella sp. 3972H.M.0a.05 TaxID=2950277 RepID=UPI003393E10F